MSCVAHTISNIHSAHCIIKEQTRVQVEPETVNIENEKHISKDGGHVSPLQMHVARQRECPLVRGASQAELDHVKGACRAHTLQTVNDKYLLSAVGRTRTLHDSLVILGYYCCSSRVTATM